MFTLAELLFLSITNFISFTLALTLVFYYLGKKVKKVILNDAVHSIAPLMIQMNREMGEAIGKKIWRQERSNKGVEARQQKRELRSELVPVLGAATAPIVDELLSFIPEKWRPLAVNYISNNPQMIQGIMDNLGQMGGGQPHGGGKGFSAPPMAQGFPSQRPPQLGLKKLQ